MLLKRMRNKTVFLWKYNLLVNRMMLISILLIALSQVQCLTAEDKVNPTRSISDIRQAPFCIDDTNTERFEEGLVGFEPIFKFHLNNSYVPVAERTGVSPSGLVTKFELQGIKVIDEDSGYDSVLYNWIHISVETAAELEGLYVQAISAPWGVPFGEFIADFDCGDCPIKTSEFQRAINIIPCIHRPALAYTHPNVFTVGGKTERRSVRKFRQVHFNFRYTQYPCVEHTFAQFLMIAVRNFQVSNPRFETFFSPIYKMKINSNPIGAYYPFYYGWKPNFIYCHQVSLDDVVKPVPGISTQWKIRYNQEFDNCVKTKAGKEWYTCPPGPIQMKGEDIPTNLHSWNLLREKYSLKEGGKTNSIHEGGVQLCPDSGIWEWMAGKMEWNTPKDMKLHKTSRSLDEVELLEGVDEGMKEEEEMVDCQEYYKDPNKFRDDPDAANVMCNETNGDPTCTDVHRNECDDINDIPAPTYGKAPDGSRQTIDRTASLSQQFDSKAAVWGENSVLQLHGAMLIFAVTVGFNILTYAARYNKEDEVIGSRTVYFGIGNWLLWHIVVTYLVIASSITGLFLISFKSHKSESKHFDELRDLCNVRSTQNETNACLHTMKHSYTGALAAILFILSYVSGWGRPTTPGLRKITIVYHISCGYLAKVCGLASIMSVYPSLKSPIALYIGLIELCNLVFYIAAWILSSLIDRKLEINPPRKIFPVLEGVGNFNIPYPYATIKEYLFPVHVIVQIVLFCLLYELL